MPRTVTIRSLPEAFSVIEEMQGQDGDWGEDYRAAGRAALVEILERQMALRVDRHLEEMARRGAVDRRNGADTRWLLSELGRIELSVPRTRQFSPHPVVRAYARRAAHIDRMIRACFVLELRIRKVASALRLVLGRRISAGTVSQVAKTLDAAVATFHCPVLVALGLRPDGKKEIIDYRPQVADTRPQARSAACRFAERRQGPHPKAVAARKAVRTTKRHRAQVPRGPSPHPLHGCPPGPHLHGPHPLRRLHPRKLNPGRADPLLPDTKHLTSPLIEVLGPQAKF